MGGQIQYELSDLAHDVVAMIQRRVPSGVFWNIANFCGNLRQETSDVLKPLGRGP